MKHEPIRLYGACYAELPYHKIEWQFKTTQGCDHHKLSLLSECPNCGARFKIPALWADGWCSRCFLPFTDMVKWQKADKTRSRTVTLARVRSLIGKA